MSQFQTYPEDAQNETFVWVAFARFDAFALDEDGYDESGRTAYVTTSEEDANRVYDTWLDGGFYPEDVAFSVRRGFVRSYPSFEDTEFNDVLSWSDDVGWSDDLDKVFGC